MKKIASFLICITLCTLLAGCTKYHIFLTVDENSHIETGLFYTSINKKALKETVPDDQWPILEKKITENLQKKLTNKDNITSEIKEDGDYIGILEKRKSANSIVSLPPGISSNQEAVLLKTDKRYKMTYSISLLADSKEIKKMFINLPTFANNYYYQKYVKLAGKPICQISIKIPLKATKTNATHKDDINHIYTWDINLDNTDKTPITIEYEKWNFWGSLLYIIIFASILINIISRLTNRQ